MMMLSVCVCVGGAGGVIAVPYLGSIITYGMIAWYGMIPS
jgi:hypothetical protein